MWQKNSIGQSDLANQGPYFLCDVKPTLGLNRRFWTSQTKLFSRHIVYDRLHSGGCRNLCICREELSTIVLVIKQRKITLLSLFWKHLVVNSVENATVWRWLSATIFFCLFQFQFNLITFFLRINTSLLCDTFRWSLPIWLWAIKKKHCFDKSRTNLINLTESRKVLFTFKRKPTSCSFCCFGCPSGF